MPIRYDRKCTVFLTVKGKARHMSGRRISSLSWRLVVQMLRRYNGNVRPGYILLISINDLYVQ